MHTSIFLTLLFLATISARRIDNDFQEQFEASNDFIRAKHYGFELPSNLRGEPAECSPEMDSSLFWYYSETTDAWFLATSREYDYQTAVNYCSSLSISNFDGELAAVNTTAENDIMASLMEQQNSASGLNPYYWSGWNYNGTFNFEPESSVADSSSIYECSDEEGYTIAYKNPPSENTSPGSPNTMVIYDDDSARFVAGIPTSQIQNVACQLRCSTNCDDTKC